jgi:hypothetical protein
MGAEGEVRTHDSTAAFLATLYLVNDTNGDDGSLIKRQLPKDTGPGSPANLFRLRTNPSRVRTADSQETIPLALNAYPRKPCPWVGSLHGFCLRVPA